LPMQGGVLSKDQTDRAPLVLVERSAPLTSAVPAGGVLLDSQLKGAWLEGELEGAGIVRGRDGSSASALRDHFEARAGGGVAGRIRGRARQSGWTGQDHIQARVAARKGEQHEVVRAAWRMDPQPRFRSIWLRQTHVAQDIGRSGEVVREDLDVAPRRVQDG